MTVPFVAIKTLIAQFHNKKSTLKRRTFYSVEVADGDSCGISLREDPAGKK